MTEEPQAHQQAMTDARNTGLGLVDVVGNRVDPGTIVVGADTASSPDMQAYLLHKIDGTVVHLTREEYEAYKAPVPKSLAIGTRFMTLCLAVVGGGRHSGMSHAIATILAGGISAPALRHKDIDGSTLTESGSLIAGVIEARQITYDRTQVVSAPGFTIQQGQAPAPITEISERKREALEAAEAKRRRKAAKLKLPVVAYTTPLTGDVPPVSEEAAAAVAAAHAQPVETIAQYGEGILAEDLAP